MTVTTEAADAAAAVGKKTQDPALPAELVEQARSAGVAADRRGRAVATVDQAVPEAALDGELTSAMTG
jgi:hypothetical protein